MKADYKYCRNSKCCAHNTLKEHICPKPPLDYAELYSQHAHEWLCWSRELPVPTTMTLSTSTLLGEAGHPKKKQGIVPVAKT